MELKKMHVRKSDTVVVMTGKDKGKTGEVLRVYPKTGRVVVRGINMVSKHLKPNKSKLNMQGGIVKVEAPIDSSNVMLYCKKCKSPRRVTHKIADNGNVVTKVRVCHKCGEEF